MWKQDTCALRPFGDGAGHIETGARVVNMQKFMVLGAVLWSMVFSSSALAQAKSTKKVAEEKDWSVFVDATPKE